MAGKVDARITRTQEKLRKALLELMKSESIDSISVTSLCKAADVNRNTFYAHYTDPPALLNEIQNELLGAIWATLSQVDTSTLDLKGFINSLLATINANRDICLIVLSPQGNRHFVNTIVSMVEGPSLTAWQQMGMTEVEANATFHYCVGGALSVIEHWVLGGYKAEVAVVAELLSDLIESSQVRHINRY